MRKAILNPSVLISSPHVAIQGEKGSFHEIAALTFFGEEIEIKMCDSFPQLFRTMEEEKASFGVMAIENSVAGSILPNYALLRDSDYQILGEVYLRIAHHLMVLPGQSLQHIKEVHSHPMALLQCQAFLSQHPEIKMVEQADTAGSAKWIREKLISGVAAIASDLAAAYYELDILKRNIETNSRNFTRFLILCKEEQIPPRKENPNKASLCFNLAGLSHKVGGLAQVLLVLSSHGMNLTKIQSLPLLGREWEYFFHIDLEFDSYAQYKRSLEAIRPIISELKILGEYSRGQKEVVVSDSPH